MKLIYSLIVLMFATLIATAQVSKPLNSVVTAGDLPAKTHGETRGAGSFYIDTEGYDDYINGGNYQTYVDWVHNRWTTPGDFLWVVQTYDSLVLTTDYVNWISYDYPSHSVTIDSIFYRIHHQNNSGLDDTLTVSIVELGAAPGYRPTTTVLWSNQTLSPVDLTGHPTTPGSYPTAIFAEAPNIVVPAGKRFGIRIDYTGDPTDTFAVIFGYPHDGATQCSTFTGIFSPIVSALYPSSYYQVKTGAATAALYPTTSNNGYWYYDCNGDGNAQWPVENPHQNWSIWAHVTIGPVGVQETTNNKIHVLQNTPNPVNEKTVIRYSLKEAGSVQLEFTDITGRVISTMNEGFRSSGVTYATSFDASQLSKGVYFYTLTTESGSVTNRMVVNR